MHYHTYNTPGLILGGLPAGESSRFIYVFTRDLGLVGAHAQNTRNINSKLRYALDSFSRAEVSLVRGKSKWRLISAVPEKSFYTIFKNEPEKQKLAAQVLTLVKKLVAGEEPNVELFEMVNEFLEFLASANFSPATTEDLKNAETVLLIRLLNMLGYMPDTENLKKFTVSTVWSREVVSSVLPVRREAIKIINDSLRATGL